MQSSRINATTKTRKHEKYVGFLRVFVVSWLHLHLQTKHEQRVACGNGDILLPIHRKRDGNAAYSTAKLNVPEWLAVFGVEREEVPFFGAAEHQAARCRQQTGQSRREQLEFPLHLSGRRLESANR